MVVPFTDQTPYYEAAGAVNTLVDRNYDHEYEVRFRGSACVSLAVSRDQLQTLAHIVCMRAAGLTA